MNRKDMQLSVRQLPNGYAVDIGGHKYMYSSAENLLEGLFYHLGLKELEYVDVKEINTLVATILTWPEYKEAYTAAADMANHCKVLQHKLRIAQAVISDFKRKYSALREENRKLLKNNG